jgi:hypothetical protein
LAGSELGKGRNGRILATAIVGGEGHGARKQEGTEANLLGCLGAREGDRRSSTAVGQGAAAEEKGDGGALAGDGRNQVVGELHRVTVKLSRGSGWLGRSCGSGSAVDRGRQR